MSAQAAQMGMGALMGAIGGASGGGGGTGGASIPPMNFGTQDSSKGDQTAAARSGDVTFGNNNFAPFGGTGIFASIPWYVWIIGGILILLYIVRK